MGGLGFEDGRRGRGTDRMSVSVNVGRGVW